MLQHYIGAAAYCVKNAASDPAAVTDLEALARDVKEPDRGLAALFAKPGKKECEPTGAVPSAP